MKAYFLLFIFSERWSCLSSAIIIVPSTLSTPPPEKDVPKLDSLFKTIFKSQNIKSCAKLGDDVIYAKVPRKPGIKIH